MGLFHEDQPELKPELLLLSANTSASLKSQVDRYQDFVLKQPDVCPSDLAYTLAVHRDTLPHRAFAVLQDGKLSVVSPPAKAPPEAPQVHLIFSGQGAQWPEMGKELIQADPTFRGSMERMDDILRKVAEPPSWSLIGECLFGLWQRHRILNRPRRAAEAGRD